MTQIKEQSSLEQLSVLTPGAKMLKNLPTEILVRYLGAPSVVDSVIGPG